MMISRASGGDDWVMDNDYEYLHGGINPAVEQDYDRVIDSIAIDAPKAKIRHQPTWSESKTPREGLETSEQLIYRILSLLRPIDLVAVSSTCRLLATHSKCELTWQRHVQNNIPEVELTSPYPCNTYRELYVAHDPHWFLPKYKIWFSDVDLTGKLIIVRYDPRRGSIVGYQLVAERPPPSFAPWEHNDTVLIHEFNPNVRLHMDQPVLQLDALCLDSLTPHPGPVIPAHRFSAEAPMRIEGSRDELFTNFLLTTPVEGGSSVQFRPRPNWPPPNIPAKYRVQIGSPHTPMDQSCNPLKRSDVCRQAFRIRKWMELPGSSASGARIGEELSTFATLDPKIYTPTDEKPYRGIWVGDYSGHGCEFLLLHQPDNETPFDEASVVQREDETPEEYEQRKYEERVYRGSVEAIKLTGDPNVPRGEYSFISDDIGHAGFIRTATESRFKDARIVESRGHIAARMFRNDKYIASQLILVSHDLLAQYWVGFGHISFFRRVNIDGFLSPFNDSMAA